ncbi:1-deoxy-D-xylulose-5-phosphate synthase [Nitratiruptor sp. SB155-2]|uniref:1-deoxy-D-xylulose-5-phosphate synthase n=1 Tax=Nitratiruptor sp. (strain SB155-2) TaxID=387092 RepID=DXS_NITSB|nr:1-deoxy-D-xylulose-5-phosphate synthase [Nitratiruptor sp. SB155-2]A6Q1Z6.1 RecName: Full=1-deoxy-D-xylulose-5-phosphate synthase; AltName: Full=1-deoxyxylulose-5-phosphate synthase; Short=DXP synthase; Short=DXPS [Nitratiruptor sp. SB155-2]BAF69505.1 1-deoxy-D-xylulose 5-phosphate synthase [Nitratiruptor sp. SB155-2]
MNIKNYTIEELEELSQKIRQRILEVVSKNGGHLSSTLGAVELIVSMHYVFDVEKDPFIFDVSHQAYAHKLLTDRWEQFDTLRQFGGISGYTKPKESPYDYWVAGHSSTSISLAVGAAKAIALKNEDRVPVVLIGDGAMSAGMVYEALNELGDRKYPVVIILNDNEMSIAKPIGAVSKYLSQKMASPFYQNMKKRTEQLLKHLPESATYIAKRMEESLKLITPGILFEELGIDYIGPIDGHDLKVLIETLTIAKQMNRPVIIHAQTLKGKGYKIAEGYYEHWHGVGPFDISTGESLKKSTKPSATSIFSKKLYDLAKEDETVVGVTAAMPSGTGLKPLIEDFGDRFWDVGIAEQHAVTSMGPLAKEGFKPFVAIYSTFLQRGYDQVIHDIALMDVGVAFAIDRAGIVGEDGETHQGAFDVSYLRPIPNMHLFAPRDPKTLEYAVEFAKDFDRPCAFRYPRGSFILDDEFEAKPFELGKAELLVESEGDVLFVGYGNGVGRAYETMKHIDEPVSLLDLRFVKPLDVELLQELSKRYRQWFVFSDSAKLGGVASALLELELPVEIVTFEYEDQFIPHGKVIDVEKALGLLPQQLAKRVKSFI